MKSIDYNNLPKNGKLIVDHILDVGLLTKREIDIQRAYGDCFIALPSVINPTDMLTLSSFFIHNNIKCTISTTTILNGMWVRMRG